MGSAGLAGSMRVLVGPGKGLVGLERLESPWWGEDCGVPACVQEWGWWNGGGGGG